MYLFLQTYGGFTAMPLARTHFFSQDTSKKKQHEFSKQTKQLGKKTEGVKARRRPQKSHGREPPHAPPPTTPAYDPPPAENAAACTTGAEDATGGGTASIAHLLRAERRKTKRWRNTEERPNEEENDKIRRAP
jgi:hypothetical protein